MFRLYRILLDPAPDNITGGGTPTTPTATEPAKTAAAATTPTATPAATPIVTPSPTPTATIALSPDEYRRLIDKEARLAEVEAEKQRVADEKEAARLKALAEKGQAEEALAQLRTTKDADIQKERDRANALEREILTDRKTAVISKALDGMAWVSAEAAADAREILEGKFEAVRDAAGTVTVREKGSGRPAADVIAEWQASPKAAHYLKPTTTGGAGAAGTNKAGGSTPADPADSDPIAKQLKAIVAARKTGAPGLAGTYGNN